MAHGAFASCSSKGWSNSVVTAADGGFFPSARPVATWTEACCVAAVVITPLALLAPDLDLDAPVEGADAATWGQFGPDSP